MGYFKEKETERVTFETDPKYWVEISLDMTWADMKRISEISDSGEVTYKLDSMLESSIVEWNLDDDNGNVLPITMENIDKLRRADIEKIVTIIGGKVKEPTKAKKAS